MKKNLTILTLSAALLVSCAGYSQTATGTVGGSGTANFITDLAAFIAPNPSNGLFNASEFDVDLLGTVSHVSVADKLGRLHDQRQFGADVALSYYFTTGLGSRFDVQYANGQVSYTSLAGIARTTFGTTNDAVVISPYTVLGAAHGVGDSTTAFNAYLGVGVEVPFHFTLFKKLIHGRGMLEADAVSTGKPNYKFGFSFDWQR